ncbi:hypothetical protein, partial [Azohydromonas lata]
MGPLRGVTVVSRAASGAPAMPPPGGVPAPPGGRGVYVAVNGHGTPDEAPRQPWPERRTRQRRLYDLAVAD